LIFYFVCRMNEKKRVVVVADDQDSITEGVFLFCLNFFFWKAQGIKWAS